MTRLHVPVPVRWADLDAYGHVNNVAVLGLLEEARIAAFWRHPEGAEPAWPTAILDAAPGAASRIAVGQAGSAPSGWRQKAAILASSRSPSTATLLTCP